MLVFIAGASGFLGARIATALLRRGHQVIAAVRDVGSLPHAVRERAIHADFTRHLEASDWLPRVRGVDVVVNAVGILRERGRQTFERLHRKAPIALFEACRQANVGKVVQISALGADAAATSAYHRSKRDADDALASLPLTQAIVQPSLVYGDDGESARLFERLAALPLIPLPGDGGQRVQPVHVDDLVEAVVRLVESTESEGRIALVGPEPLALREFLGRLRRAMGMRKPRYLPVPIGLVRLAARIGDRLPGTLLDRETLAMLERGNVADPTAARALLLRDPLPVEGFVKPADVAAVRLRAKLGYLLPLLRLSIAAVWIVTGIVSLGVYPVEQSYALLERVGATGGFATLLLYGAAITDLALGIATLALPWRTWLYIVQMLLIVGYTVLITWKLPEFWLHPYGPILKNLPLLAALWLLRELDDGNARGPGRWTT